MSQKQTEHLKRIRIKAIEAKRIKKLERMAVEKEIKEKMKQKKLEDKLENELYTEEFRAKMKIKTREQISNNIIETERLEYAKFKKMQYETKVNATPSAPPAPPAPKRTPTQPPFNPIQQAQPNPFASAFDW